MCFGGVVPIIRFVLLLVFFFPLSLSPASAIRSRRSIDHGGGTVATSFGRTATGRRRGQRASTRGKEKGLVELVEVPRHHLTSPPLGAEGLIWKVGRAGYGPSPQDTGAVRPRQVCGGRVAVARRHVLPVGLVR